MMHSIPLSLMLLVIPSALAAPTCGLKSASSTSSAAGAASTTSTSTGTNSTSTSTSTSEPISAAWYPDYAGLEPSDISWSKYTMMTYAFGLTTPNISEIAITNTSDLSAFVAAAHDNNVDALLSIGGWGGSQYFSSAVASAENRTAFVKTITDLVNDYGLDGIDFDWEYPASLGIGCNTNSTDDTANYLSFLQELREDATGKDMYISGAVAITPFVGSDGAPMTNVSGFADVFDHIAIMNYDISGSWSATVGPNAPLNDTCATTATGSAVSAVKAWTEAGMPAEQIVLGVAAYGHSFNVTTLDGFASDGSFTSFPPADPANFPLGDSSDGPSTDVCGVTASHSGVFTFNGLISSGFLTENGTAADGVEYIFDECSQTPFVYNSTTQVMVSYDDATSFAAKGSFILEQGLKGFAMWNAAGDSQDILLDAINGGMGVESDSDSA